MSSPSCPYTICSIAVGTRRLHFRFTLSHPVPVFRPRAGLPLADLTTWELLRYLVNNGWSDGKNSRAVPYVHDGVAHYFAKRVITVRGHHYYFLVLASAEVLFSRGVVSVHHHQPVDYYKCLLSLPAEHVVRGKAASHYEELLAKAVKSVKSRAAKKPALTSWMTQWLSPAMHHFQQIHCCHCMTVRVGLSQSLTSGRSSRYRMVWLYFQVRRRHRGRQSTEAPVGAGGPVEAGEAAQQLHQPQSHRSQQHHQWSRGPSPNMTRRRGEHRRT
jgi:hypothetical protein